MPWTKTNYPASMKNLPYEIRNKAIEIGNAMNKKQKDMDEGILIATAISRAKEWSAGKETTGNKTSQGTGRLREKVGSVLNKGWEKVRKKISKKTQKKIRKTQN